MGADEGAAELHSQAKFPSSSSSLCCCEPFSKESDLPLAPVRFQSYSTVILFQEQKEIAEDSRFSVCSLLSKKALFILAGKYLLMLEPIVASAAFAPGILHHVHSGWHLLQGILTAVPSASPQLGNLHLCSFFWSEE